jgi:hypothetical protein
MTQTPDLWPDTTVQADDLPVAILRQQAEYLGQRHAQRLTGRVEARPLGQQMWLTLSIVAPALNHYSYRLLDVRYGMGGYPATVSFYDDELQVQTRAQFERWLKDVFADHRTQLVIAQLEAAIDAQTGEPAVA